MLRVSWNLPPRRRESLYQDPFTTTVSLSCIEGFQVIKHIHWWPEPSSQTLNTGCNCVWRLIFAISGQHLTMYTVYFFAGLHWKVAVTSLIPLLPSRQFLGWCFISNQFFVLQQPKNKLSDLPGF